MDDKILLPYYIQTYLIVCIPKCCQLSKRCKDSSKCDTPRKCRNKMFD